MQNIRRTLAAAAIAIVAFLPAIVCVVPAPAFAQSPADRAADPADLRALSDLLGKPAIRAWLQAQSGTVQQAAPAADKVGEASMMGSRLDAARLYLQRLTAAIPNLPDQLRVVSATLMGEVRARGVLGFLGPLVAFVGLGTLMEALFWYPTAGLRRRAASLPLDTVEQRVAAIGWRSLYALGVIAAFALGSVGAFLALDWPPLLQEVVLTYLMVFLAVRLAMVAGRIVLAPGAERFRLLPLSTSAARYWFVWSAVLVGAFYAMEGTFRLVPVLGATLETRTLVGIALSVLVLGLALVVIWRRPAADGTPRTRRAQDGIGWLLSFYLVGVWLTAFTGETAPFDIGVVLLLVTLATLAARKIVDHLLRPAGDPGTDTGGTPLAAVALDRGARIALIFAGALAVAHSLGINLTDFAVTDTPAQRLTRGALNIVVIALAADFAWQIARAWIDRSVVKAASMQSASTEAEIRHGQRLRTLLPVLRNVLLIGLIAVAALTALSTLGVDVAPLVAGAGVVGIAVGFGAQTLVKDILSGLFFLFDDAFRVGEYIESGAIKGTVESFSLRSIKLRHQRGALHTVPFGALSTITNYSRDWVIDKTMIGVTYDTDLGRVKRIVKEIGQKLLDDPEFAPNILETFKMQGVEQFGDFAVQLQLKMMTRPGEQHMIRRRALLLLKQAFDANGIKFAYPTVTVAGGMGESVTAAAQLGLEQAKSTPAKIDGVAT
jgi:small-conductance mechanosensitive channel